MGQVFLRGIRKSYGAVDVIKFAGLETVTGADQLTDGDRANELRPADRGAASALIFGADGLLLG